jgi:hypothetical protein
MDLVEKEKFMKQFKSTIIIFIIFLGFTGYYFLFEKKKTKVVEENKLLVFNFNKDDFKTLELSDMSDGSGILLKKDKDWKIEKPVEMPASIKTVDGMISELAVLTADRDITENKQQLKTYGLDVPKYKVKFSLENETHTLFIGIKNPTEEFYFVKEDTRDNIYTVNISSVDRFIRKNITDLRDKEFLRISEDEIRKIDIDINNKGKLIVEKNKENKWMIQNAIKKDLSKDIQNVFEELNSLTIEEFIEKGSLNLKDYGLDKPFYSVTVDTIHDGSINLCFGKMENNLVYVTKNKEKIFFKVRRNIIDSFENLYINMKEKQDLSDPERDQKKK